MTTNAGENQGQATGAVVPAAASAATATPAAAAAVKANKAEPVVCPRCQSKKCPAVGGSHRGATNVVQYRVCGNRECAFKFKTTQMLDEKGKAIGAEFVSG